MQSRNRLTETCLRAKKADSAIAIARSSPGGDSEEKRRHVMSCRKMIRWVVVAVLFLLVAVDASLALDNLRVAYPSLNTSVFALIIAEKEGYMKEEGLNVELPQVLLK